MINLTLSAARLTTLSGPQDAIDLRRVLTVNTPLQTLGGAILKGQSEQDITDNVVAGLPGVGTNYGTSISVPATSAVSLNGEWLPSTADSLMSGLALQTNGGGFPEAVIGLQCIPLVGKITHFSMGLIGRGPGVGHTQMPANPIKAELRYVCGGGSTISTLLGTATEAVGQTYTGYDVFHYVTSAAITHTIAHRAGSANPAHYQILLYSEYGTGAITGGIVYSFTIFCTGVDI